MDKISSFVVFLNVDKVFNDKVVQASKEICAKYGSEFVVDDKRYPVHLTLYLFAAPEKNKKKIIETAAVLSQIVKPETLNVKRVVAGSNGWVMIDIKERAKIYEYHIEALELFNNLRGGQVRQKYRDPQYLATLSSREIQMLEEYGARHILEEYHPHLSLAQFEDVKIAEEVQRKYEKRFLGLSTRIVSLVVHEEVYGEDGMTVISTKKIFEKKVVGK